MREAIAAHARAVVAGDVGAAEGCVRPAALEAYRAAIGAAASLGPFDGYAAPALARLGTQYISKVRFTGARGSALMQIRWARESDGRWQIAEAEYFPPGYTPWSGVKRPRPAAWSCAGPAGENR
ncbi:MAG TPA: hypothetical protein VGI29_06010 [Candidatus Binataceae bacterium]